MAPSRGLLYYALFIINMYFQRTMPGVINFCIFKELYFSEVFYSRHIRATAILNSEKLFFYIGPVASIWYLLEFQRPNFSIYPYRIEWIPHKNLKLQRPRLLLAESFCSQNWLARGFSFNPRSRLLM